MAKDKNSQDGLVEVELENDSALPVLRVEVPEEASDEWHRWQAEELQKYKVSGHAGAYIDPTRDQEPDISPEFGVSPHPELANPAPPASSFSGRSSLSPMVAPVEEKEEAGADALEAFNEVLAAREEASANGFSDSPDAQPVYVVDAPEPAGEGMPAAPLSDAPQIVDEQASKGAQGASAGADEAGKSPDSDSK